MSFGSYGIGALRRQQNQREQMRAVGEKAIKEQLEDMARQMEHFKRQLEKFAMKHRKEINKNPIFRRDFQRMCQSSGVDPLASNKGFWAKLGLGDFFYDLGVQIIDACVSSRAQNGGLVRMSELLRYLTAMRGPKAQRIGEDDVERAIRKLTVLGSSFAVVTIGADKYVRSVPQELKTDHAEVMRLADGDSRGRVTAEQARARLGWPAERVAAALNELIARGVAMVDDQDPSGTRTYWFLSMLADILG